MPSDSAKRVGQLLVEPEINDWVKFPRPRLRQLTRWLVEQVLDRRCIDDDELCGTLPII